MTSDQELEAIGGHIGRTFGARFMDPPDGGDVGLSEQVKRMCERLKELEAAPATVEMPKDGRRPDWTEALAISFMAANGHNPEMGMFAKSFNEGAWREIENEWPEFIEFADARLTAALAPATEGES